MSFFSGMTAQNAMDVLIGKSISRTANVQILSPTGSGYIADGEILVLDQFDNPLIPGSTIADSPKIRIVQRSGSNLKYSVVIDGQNVVAYKGIPASAGQEQIHVVGYNGTSGAISTVATERLFKMTYKFDENKWACQPMRRVYGTRETTQQGIANDIASQINYESYPVLMGEDAGSAWVSAEILCSATSGDSSVLDNAATLTVVKGSKVAVASVTNHNVVAGDWIRIGAEDTTTFPVYKVASVSGANITFTMPYQGASATVANANTGRITAATSLTSAFGIKLTGLPLSFGLAPYTEIPFNKVAFDVHLGTDWGTTALTKTQEMVFGTGLYQQVSNMDLMGRVFAGVQSVNKFPLDSGFVTDASSAATYDCIYIRSTDLSNGTPITGPNHSMHETYLFLVDGASQTSDVLHQLDTWMNSTPKAFDSIGAL